MTVKNTLKIGWAQTNITPSGSALMEGQMYTRYSRYVHDPLTATALVLDNGEEQAVFVSMDMTEVPLHAMQPLKEALAGSGIPFDKISFNVTHTHNSTSFFQDFMRKDNEAVYDPEILPPFRIPEGNVEGEQGQRFFVCKLRDLILLAWNSRESGGISFAHEYAAVAFSRRPQFLCEQGTETVMYGDCSRKDFFRFEGGTDTSVELMYTWNDRQEITGVICNVPCPSQVYELHYFLSADYWAPTRAAIREKLGKNVFVLPLCGAAGDLAPIDLVHISKNNQWELLQWGGQTGEVLRNFDMTQVCQDIGSRISDAVMRGYKTARNYIDHNPAFFHEVIEMKLPIRQVSVEEFEAAQEEVRKIHERFSPDAPMSMADLVKAFEPQGVILRYRQQQKSAFYGFRSHIIRLGDVGFATNPFELYHEFALRMKARAVPGQLFVVQLANGLGGYLPTKAAVSGGSYSSKPASTVCGPEAGDILVETTLEMLELLWQKT